MKYAYKNGKILNGTKDMQVQTGLIILTEGEKIAAIVPEETRLSGYTEVDLQGKYKKRSSLHLLRFSSFECAVSSFVLILQMVTRCIVSTALRPT